MRRSLASGLLLGLSSLAAAVFRDEVGDIDFHYALVGLPQPDTTFFHRPRKEDKASLVYTLSDIGILAAVNPSNGELVWRHQLAAGDDGGRDDAAPDRRGFLRAPDGEDWLAAAHGSSVQAWSALTGRNVWRVDFAGEVRDLEILELTESSRKDVLALFDEDGVTVLRRLHGGLGTVVWEFRENSRDVPLQVSNDIANVYVVSLHGAAGAYNLKVTSLEPATGARVDHWMVGLKGDIHGPADVAFVGANSAAPIVAWTNQGLTKLSVNVIGSKSKQDFALPPESVSVRVHAPHLAQSQTHFLAHIRIEEADQALPAHKAIVFHTDLKTSQIKVAYELPAFRGEGTYSTSSEGANVYFVQTTSDQTLIVSSDSHGILARWPNKQALDLHPAHAVTEVVKKAGSQDFAARSAILTKSDDWTMLRNGENDWTRREGLSDAVGAVWAEIPEAEDLAKVLADEAHTNPLSAYVHRVARHVDDLKYLPAYLAALPERLLGSIAGAEPSSTKQPLLRRDSFGFSKILVVVTRRGRVYGLDSGNHGRVIWSCNSFPLSMDRPLVLRGLVADDERGTVAMYGAGGWYAVFNASSGVALEVSVDQRRKKSGVSSTAVVYSESGKDLLPVGPDGLPAGDLPAGWDPEQTVVLRGEGETLRGVRFRAEGGDRVASQEMWRLPMRPGQKIVQVATPPSHDPIASIGRVLGDRRVLYKYLNPNSVVVAAADETTKTLSVQLVDTVSGQVLASQLHRGVDATKSISCTMAENWYTCSFFGDHSVGDGDGDKAGRAVKGYQLVMTDLYESPAPDSRGPLGDAANFSR
ncbi:hypothetical protein CDD83_3025 [Cordyceps sp. RAO-2017]|nr:hypothetical protein CDD83_3025 [Cordyceps sp. RAO-2017]